MSSVTAATVRAMILRLLRRRRDVLDPRIEANLSAVGVDDHPPGPAQEPVNALDALHAPGLDGLQRAHEHLVEPQAVGAILGDDVVGVDHVAPALGHLVGPGVDAEFGSSARTNPSPFLMTWSSVELDGLTARRARSLHDMAVLELLDIAGRDPAPAASW